MKTFEGKKFLIVDDDQNLRETIGDVFRRHAAQVTEAENGAVAFSMIQKDWFDVIIADVRMTAGDGINLAKNILELPGKKPLVFICSGFCDLSIKSAAQYNIAHVFEKPFANSHLVQVISSHLANVVKQGA